MNLSQSLHNMIIPGKGIEGLTIGDKISKHYDEILSENYTDIKVFALYPQSFVYNFKESILIYVNILNGEIVRIDLCKGYHGKTIEGVGIGSTVEYLRGIHHTILFDESYLLIGNQSELIISLDYTDTIRDLDSINNSRITQITIEMPKWR